MNTNITLKRRRNYGKFLFTRNDSIMNYHIQKLKFLEDTNFTDILKKAAVRKKNQSAKAYKKTLKPLLDYLGKEEFNKLIEELKTDIAFEFQTSVNGKIESIFKNLQLTAEGIKHSKTQVQTVINRQSSSPKVLEQRANVLAGDLGKIKSTFIQIQSIQNIQNTRINIEYAQQNFGRIQDYCNTLTNLLIDIKVKNQQFRTYLLADYAEYAAALAAEKTLTKLENEFKNNQTVVDFLKKAKLILMGTLKQKVDFKIKFFIPISETESKEIFVNISNKATQNLEEMRSNKLVNFGGFIEEIEKTRKKSKSEYGKYELDYKVLSHLYLLNPAQKYKNEIFNILERFSRYAAMDISMEALGLNSPDPVLFLQIGNKLYTGEEVYDKIANEKLFFYIGQFMGARDFFILRDSQKLYSPSEEILYRRNNRIHGKYQMYVQTKLTFNTVQAFLRKSAVNKLKT